MSNYADLKAQVASDLRRSNLPTEIASTILDAIRDHGAEHFYFNETTTYTLPLVAGQDEYAITAQAPVAEFVKIDWVRALVNNVWIKLVRVDTDEMEYFQSFPSSGQPSMWTPHANTIRFFPTPDKPYTARIAGHYRLIDLAADTDANSWTNEGKNLIRYSTVKRLFTYPIRDTAQMQVAEAAEVRELEYLRRETDRRQRTGSMKAYY